ncbi:MAG: ATP-binding protein [Chloroflexi bacterium]|nr:ATP-binding protein [Chloroflexota bacterium]
MDRRRELLALKRFMQQPLAGLMILFGRRRVGKTRLLSYFIEEQSIPEAFYWTATTHGEAYQLRDFSGALLRYASQFGVTPTGADFSFTNWEAAFRFLADAVARAETPQLIVLDEFTYLIRNNAAITSVLQKTWDHHLSHQLHLRLVLTGSLVGMMEREVLSYQAPLYGRATSLLRLRPLPYAALIELFPEREPAERVAIYGVTGGVPAYLELFARAPTFARALQEQFLAPGSIVLTDPALILHEQLQEPQVYESVLSAIASGFHTWKDIARMAGVVESSLGHYLKVLQELELVERGYPVLSRPGGRQGRYYVKDHFLRFYYRFIVPHITNIERGYEQAAYNQIRADLRAFMGTHVFEELCREWVIAAAVTNDLDFHPEVVGAYWRRHRGVGVQLDVVAASKRERKLLIGEAKWGKRLIGRKVLVDLMKRSQRMPQTGEGWDIEYVLFAREGFTEDVRLLADEVGARLITLAEIERKLIEALGF